MSRTLAIGDIHGCAAALQTLLEVIELKPADTLVTLGDYVDRGTGSRGVIERLLDVASECNLVPLIGNHEVMMLQALDQGGDALQFWLECGGRATLDSYGGSPRDVPDAHLEFLRATKPFHETENNIFVHANYQADLEMNRQPHELMHWEHLFHQPPEPHRSGKTVFVGHTPQRSGNVLDLGHVVCIDTACVMGGKLTAIDVETRQFWQADADGRLS